jgi:hypothetical protein
MMTTLLCFSVMMTPDFEKFLPTNEGTDFARFRAWQRTASDSAVGHYTGSVVERSRFLGPSGARPSCLVKNTTVVPPGNLSHGGGMRLWFAGVG